MAHEAFFFADDDELVARCLPFIREGFERDEDVLLVGSRTTVAALVSVLGADADRLALCAESADVWQGGHGTVQLYDRVLRDLAQRGKACRLIGEPVWLEHADAQEWHRIETAYNRAYEDVSHYALCLHDLRHLAPAHVAEVQRTHPLVWGGASPVPSASFMDPDAYVRLAEPAWLQAPPDASRAVVSDTRTARRFARQVLTDGGLDDRADDTLLAVHELVANALRAAGSAELSAWTDGEGRLVLEVRDDGPGFTVGVAGYTVPEPDGENGRGLWLARAIADDSAVRSTSAGTAVRLFLHR
nr:sensor histidine kinase [Kineococcus aurantiacus]